MIIALHQPNYLPNLSLFHKMTKVDKFIITTNVQYSRSGYHSRNKIRSGEHDLWLTIPIKGSKHQIIKDIMIDNTHKWRNKHKQGIQHTYGKTKEKEFLDQFISLYERNWDSLIDLNINIIDRLTSAFGITTQVIIDNRVCADSDQSLLIKTCRKYNADTYLSGLGAKDYINDQHIDNFKRNKISHQFIDRDVASEFPYSAIHYIFTEGFEDIKQKLEIN